MGWVKLDTGFFRNPKVMRARPQTQLLFLATLCWAGEQATDGHVSHQALRRVAAELEQSRSKDRADELVALGLWEEQPEGWLIHDFLLWQDSAEDRAYQAERNRGKQQRFRDRRRSNPVSNPVTKGSSNRLRDRLVTGLDVDVDVEKRKHTRDGGPDRASMEVDFGVWYQAYPRKRERESAKRSYLARRRAGIEAKDLLLAAERYAEHGRKTNRPPDKTKHPATFLNNGWDDWLPGGPADQEAPPPQGAQPVDYVSPNGHVTRMAPGMVGGR